MRSVFDEYVMDVEDDGDTQCIESNVFFLSEEFMISELFVAALLQHCWWVSASSSICRRATTFYALPLPLPRQVPKAVQKGV